MKNPILSAYIEKRGPPTKLEEAVKSFKQKWRATYIKNGRLYTRVKRKFAHADAFLKNLLGERLKSDKALKLIKTVKWH